MYRDNHVAVVVPAYNESGFVGEVIETVPAFVDRVYAVDDRSTDDTWDEIREAADRMNTSHRVDHPIADGGQQDDRFVVPIRHEQNTGVGGAIKTGYRRAYADGIDVVAVMNGDGRMDPAILDRILDPVVSGRADYAKGNRLARGIDRRGMPPVRLFGNLALSLLTKIASGYWRMLDPQNGYTAISRRALETLEINELYDRYGFANDVLIRCNAAGLRVADVPMRARYGDERSHVRMSTFVPSVSRLLFSGLLWRLRTRYLVFDFHPLVALFPLALFGLLAGFAGSVAVALGIGTAGDGAVARTLVLAVVGISAVLLSTGLLLDRHASDPLWVHVEGEVGPR
jgi:glycosyltransferase involved in cell wall biosynthesis